MKEVLLKIVTLAFSTVGFVVLRMGYENYLKESYKKAKNLIKKKKYLEAIPILKDIVSQRKYKDSEKLLKIATEKCNL